MFNNEDTSYTKSPEYRKAFVDYMRYGTPINIWEIKSQIESKRYYIWRTSNDGKVRPSHAANNGRMFSWDNPPVTGHPGHEAGCRCWAEKIPENRVWINGEIPPYQQRIPTVDAQQRWTTEDFIHHAYHGKGRDVTLSEIGHLNQISKTFLYKINKDGLSMEERINKQIEYTARRSVTGKFTDSFIGSYDFKDVSFSHGAATIKGYISGNVRSNNDILIIDAQVRYEFTDLFTDPFDLREIQYGTSDPQKLLEILRKDPIIKDPEKQFNQIMTNTERGTRMFKITGSWESEFHALIPQ